LAVPYWDSTLDSYLPNPADSVWFSEILMGEADKNGDVYKSVFKNFTTLDANIFWEIRLTKHFRIGPLSTDNYPRRRTVKCSTTIELTGFSNRPTSRVLWPSGSIF
jgi:hypothetical protein